MWLTRPVLDRAYQNTNSQHEDCLKFPLGSEDKNTFLKEQLIRATFTFLDLFILTYFSVVAHKQKLYYGISKARKNVLNLKEQIIWAQSVVISFFLVHIGVNTSLHLLSGHFDEDHIFMIWWLAQLFMFIFAFNIIPFIIVIIALKKYPEFLGYRASVFPGQEKPRKICVEPARLIPEIGTVDSVRVVQMLPTTSIQQRFDKPCCIEMPPVDIH